MAKKYNLLPIPLKQPFSNSGINERVPYTLPAQEDNLNWLEGFTDAFQRPVVPSELGQNSGRYIRMGQLNQVLNNVSTAILNVKQGLDNVQGTIDKDLNAKIDKVVTEANKVINNRKVTWLQTINNQTCAGLKNFTGVNINNFKTSPTAVANTELSQGFPIWSVELYNRILNVGANFTISNKNVQFIAAINAGFWSGSSPSCAYFILNNIKCFIHNNPHSRYANITSSNPVNIYLRKGDVVSFVSSYSDCSTGVINYNLLGT